MPLVPLEGINFGGPYLEPLTINPAMPQTALQRTGIKKIKSLI